MASTHQYTHSSVLLCNAYRSKKDNQSYLFVDALEGFARVPEALKALFSEQDKIIGFKLTEDKRLPGADAKKVLSSIHGQGFYLQMPPLERAAELEKEQQEIAAKNSKLASS